MRRPAAGPVAAVAALLALALLPVALLPTVGMPVADAAVSSAVAVAAATPRTGDLTLTLRDAWWEQHGPERRTSGSLSAEAPSAMSARPTTSGTDLAWEYPTDADVVRTCTVRVCVHRVTAGDHAASQEWAEQALHVLEKSWRRLVGRLDFPAPAPDGENGGDARFDVYLADVGALGQYGFCAPEALVGGQDRRASSYCILDNDMAGLPGRTDDNLAVTAAHELFHAIQFNLDLAEDTWFMEATATWAEHHVFGALRANRQYLRDGQLGVPSRPLDSQAAMYGNWLFVHWLVQRHGPGAVRAIWRRLDGSVGRADEWSVQGVARYVTRRGGDWPATYRAFAEANAFPARHRGISGLGRLRPKADARVRLTRTRQQKRRTLRLDHLTSRRLVVESVRRGPRVRLVLQTSRPAQVSAVVVLVRRDGTRKRRVMTPDRRGQHRGRAVVRYDPRKVRRAVVVVANTSRAYVECRRHSGWACGGRPVHDDTRVTLRARLAT